MEGHSRTSRHVEPVDEFGRRLRVPQRRQVHFADPQAQAEVRPRSKHTRHGQLTLGAQLTGAEEEAHYRQLLLQNLALAQRLKRLHQQRPQPAAKTPQPDDCGHGQSTPIAAPTPPPAPPPVCVPKQGGGQGGPVTAGGRGGNGGAGTDASRRAAGKRPSQDQGLGPGGSPKRLRGCTADTEGGLHSTQTGGAGTQAGGVVGAGVHADGPDTEITNGDGRGHREGGTHRQESDPHRQESDPHRQESDPHRQESDPHRQESHTDSRERSLDSYGHKSSHKRSRSDKRERGDRKDSRSDRHSKHKHKHSKHESSRHKDSRHKDSRHESSRHESSRHNNSKHKHSKHKHSKHERRHRDRDRKSDRGQGVRDDEGSRRSDGSDSTEGGTLSPGCEWLLKGMAEPAAADMGQEGQVEARATGQAAGQTRAPMGMDMFSDTFETPPAAGVGPQPVAVQGPMDDHCDDQEGFHRFRAGELLAGRYLVYDLAGKGVFSTALRARDTEAGPNDPSQVVVKVLRRNDLMYRAGQKEAQWLRMLAATDTAGRGHCVRLHGQVEHLGHMCLVLDAYHTSLRQLLRRQGANGLRLQAVRVYARQMLLALRLLGKCGLAHGDIKPDNIMLGANMATLALCDFGTAVTVPSEGLTPYLVSRYYRAPELMLGLAYDGAIDMWAVACTLYELYTGNVLFAGHTNNHMLKLHMELLGPIPHRLVRKAALRAQHYTDDCDFVFTDPTAALGKDTCRVGPIQATRDLLSELQAAAAVDDKAELVAFRDFLVGALALDPKHRLQVRSALHHPFIVHQPAPQPAPQPPPPLTSQVPRPLRLDSLARGDRGQPRQGTQQA